MTFFYQVLDKSKICGCIRLGLYYSEVDSGGATYSFCLGSVIIPEHFYPFFKKVASRDGAIEIRGEPE